MAQERMVQNISAHPEGEVLDDGLMGEPRGKVKHRRRSAINHSAVLPVGENPKESNEPTVQAPSTAHHISGCLPEDGDKKIVPLSDDEAGAKHHLDPTSSSKNTEHEGLPSTVSASPKRGQTSDGLSRMERELKKVEADRKSSQDPSLRSASKSDRKSRSSNEQHKKLLALYKDQVERFSQHNSRLEERLEQVQRDNDHTRQQLMEAMDRLATQQTRISMLEQENSSLKVEKAASQNVTAVHSKRLKRYNDVGNDDAADNLTLETENDTMSKKSMFSSDSATKHSLVLWPPPSPTQRQHQQQHIPAAKLIQQPTHSGNTFRDIQQRRMPHRSTPSLHSSDSPPPLVPPTLPCGRKPLNGLPSVIPEHLDPNERQQQHWRVPGGESALAAELEKLLLYQKNHRQSSPDSKKGKGAHGDNGKASGKLAENELLDNAVLMGALKARDDSNEPYAELNYFEGVQPKEHKGNIKSKWRRSPSMRRNDGPNNLLKKKGRIPLWQRRNQPSNSAHRAAAVTASAFQPSS